MATRVTHRCHADGMACPAIQLDDATGLPRCEGCICDRLEFEDVEQSAPAPMATLARP